MYLNCIKGELIDIFEFFIYLNKSSVLICYIQFYHLLLNYTYKLHRLIKEICKNCLVEFKSTTECQKILNCAIGSLKLGKINFLEELSFKIRLLFFKGVQNLYFFRTELLKEYNKMLVFAP